MKIAKPKSPNAYVHLLPNRRIHGPLTNPKVDVIPCIARNNNEADNIPCPRLSRTNTDRYVIIGHHAAKPIPNMSTNEMNGRERKVMGRVSRLPGFLFAVRDAVDLSCVLWCVTC